MSNGFVICIYDKVADVFSRPIVFDNEACATRYFKSLVINNPNKDDYELHHVGSFDFKTGTGTYNTKPVLILKGNQVNKEE